MSVGDLSVIPGVVIVVMASEETKTTGSSHSPPSGWTGEMCCLRVGCYVWANLRVSHAFFEEVAERTAVVRCRTLRRNQPSPTALTAGWRTNDPVPFFLLTGGSHGEAPSPLVQNCFWMTFAQAAPELRTQPDSAPRSNALCRETRTTSLPLCKLHTSLRLRTLCI